jgi:Tol biopolymer transport system component
MSCLFIILRRSSPISLGLIALVLGAFLFSADWGQPSQVDAAQLAASCDVKAAQKLADGGDPAWSPDGQLLAYQRWDASGVYQLRVMRPDGSGDRCLSCAAASGSPLVNRHKVNPSWHPSGRFLVLQAEMDSNPMSWDRGKLVSELYINAVWTNIYAVTADGQQWYRLTDYSNTATDGAMGTRLSRDGSKLLWSRIIRPMSDADPWGAFRLMSADFVVDAGGKPSIQNIRDLTPSGGGLFFESHGFTPDGKAVLMASDRGTTHKWGVDLWTMDLASGAVKNLTQSPSWEEHATYSPDGRKIAFMSSAPYDWLWLTFQSELMLMSPDGSNKRQLTHFNVSGFPDSAIDRDKKRSMVAGAAWSTDGTRIAVTRQLADWDYPAREVWLLTFNGPCGIDQSG